MKTMCKITSFLSMILLGVAVMVAPSFVSKAVTNPCLTISRVEAKEISEIKKCVKAVNTGAMNIDKSPFTNSTKFLDFNEDTGVSTSKDKVYNLEINMSVYNNIESQTMKQDVMKVALIEIDNSGISKINKGKIYNFISNNDKATSNLVRQLSDDVQADYISAYSSIRPFTGVIGWILGVITLGIFLLLTFTIVFDMAYLVIPFWQAWLNTHTKEQKPPFVSIEAWNAIKQAEEGSTFREPLGLYCKLKSKQFMALGICLLYLVSGQIFQLVAMIMDAFSGMLPS